MSLLHVDRPCRVRRLSNGRWGWSCWCCPMPPHLVTATADTFRLAVEDADAHIRTEHTTTPTTADPTTDLLGDRTMSAPINHTEYVRDPAGGTPGPVVGPDGTPLVDDPIETAERLARLADELAALTDQMAGVLAWQDATLAMIHPAGDDGTDNGTGGGNGRRYLLTARRVNARLANSLMLLRDSLGEVHVTGDELADRLRRILAPHEQSGPAVRGAVA